MRLYDYFINNKDLINHLESIAINKRYSFFKYKDNINLNIKLNYRNLRGNFYMCS